MMKDGAFIVLKILAIIIALLAGTGFARSFLGTSDTWGNFPESDFWIVQWRASNHVGTIESSWNSDSLDYYTVDWYSEVHGQQAGIGYDKTVSPTYPKRISDMDSAVNISFDLSLSNENFDTVNSQMVYAGLMLWFHDADLKWEETETGFTDECYIWTWASRISEKVISSQLYQGAELVGSVMASGIKFNLLKRERDWGTGFRGWQWHAVPETMMGEGSTALDIKPILDAWRSYGCADYLMQFRVAIETLWGINGASTTFSHINLPDFDDGSPLSFDLLAPADASDNVSEELNTYIWSASTNATSYTFKLDDNADISSPIEESSGITDTSHRSDLPLAPGATYYWQVIAENVAGRNSSAIYSFNSKGESVSSQEKVVCEGGEIALYPNPSNHCIYLYTVAGIVEVSIFSSSGRKLLEQSVSSNAEAIDISLLEAGYYIIQINSTLGNTQVKRFIKY